MTKRVLLVGNPNCGKTTLFNALTGSQQKVGNWPGVTIEKKSGWYVPSDKTVEIIDLPGVYSLNLPENVSAKDAQITAQILARDPHIDLIINVVDACHLERHLYLTSQLLELGKPVVVALNMMDIAAQTGIHIDTEALSKQFSCPVIALQAHRQIGLEDLDGYISTQQYPAVLTSALNDYLPTNVVQYINSLSSRMLLKYPESSHNTLYYTYRYLEQNLQVNEFDTLASMQELDIVLADARYQMVHHWVAAAQTKRHDVKEQFTAKLDRILLHRFWGLPIFFALMYGVFFLSIGFGGAIQSGFDLLSEALFIQMPAWLLSQWHAPAWLIQLCAYGVGQAFHTLITFIPVLATMYFLLAFLEASGYMARVAFIMDRVMRSLGLPGQAFVPMIIGFGCNVPAILAARTMHTERDRFLTVLMNPYMSCSARLAIYAVFVAAFFPNKGYQVIFSLYFLGIIMAVLTGYLAKRTFLTGQTSPLILELPTYHCPTLQRLAKEAGLRLRYFLVRAGKVILPVCLLLSALNSSTTSMASLFSELGKWIMPIFSPMGIHPDNWPAVMSLMTGMLAKEVVIGTLNNLYSQIDHITNAWQTVLPIDFWQTIKQAGLAISTNLQVLFGWSIEPSDAADIALPALLRQHFGSSLSAYAYLIFILLYMPCVSTMAAIRQEANRSLMWCSIVWSLGLAYGTSVLFYQVMSQPMVLYYSGLGLLLLVMIGMLLRSRSLKLGDARCSP